MSHLLDSNAWIDWLRRGTASRVHTRLTSQSGGEVFLCSVVLGELLFGASNGDPEYLDENLALIHSLQQEFRSLPYDDDAAVRYARIRVSLKRLGTPIGPNDTKIAAIALANDLTLVTHNTAEFSRVPGLKLEDWQ